MINILIDAPRPGDFYLWIARICELEKKIPLNNVNITITKRSLFFDLKHLFSGYITELNFSVIEKKADYEKLDGYSGEHTKAGEPLVPAGKYDFQALYKKFGILVTRNAALSEDILCFVTLECEKRKFHSQYELLVEFADMVRRELGKKVCFINNGLTSTLAGELRNVESDQHLFEKNYLSRLCKEAGSSYLDLYGETIPIKLNALKNCDFAISSLGTASILPYACNVPTLNFGNRYLHRVCQRDGINKLENNELIIPLKVTKLLDEEINFSVNNFKNKAQLISYDIDKEDFVAYLTKLISLKK